MTIITAEAPIDFGALGRRLRYPAAIAVIALALITVLAAVGHTSNNGQLDPRNATPDGGRALAALLSAREVSVSVATSVAQLDRVASTTVLITDPQIVSTDALREVAAGGATVVLIDPTESALQAFGVPAVPDARLGGSPLDPGCSLGAATTAGSARIDGDLYRPHGQLTTCYGEQGDFALLSSIRASGGTTTVFGSVSTFTNAELAKDGDAALALGLLSTPKVQWVTGRLDAGPAPKAQRGLFHLLPSRLLWAVLQLFIAVVVLALWRARRLGRVVVEPLPVVVRAAETVEGRARLMHAANARGAAAKSLRTAAIRRLSQALRLGPDDDPDAVVALVAERSQASAAGINGLLYGGDPPDDAALVKLAQDLPKLEAAVHRGESSSPGGQS